MHISGESLAVILLVGLIAGWLAGSTWGAGRTRAAGLTARSAWATGTPRLPPLAEMGSLALGC